MRGAQNIKKRQGTQQIHIKFSCKVKKMNQQDNSTCDKHISFSVCNDPII